MPENDILVSVVMPLRNEEKHIGNCIESLLLQDFPRERMELLLVDGASTDATRDIILGYAARHPFIRLLDNPNKTVPFAMNIGIRAARGGYIVRLDAHSEYADDYVTRCVEALDQTGADNAGGPMIARGHDPLQQAIAASYRSAFALGGGKFHDPNHEGYVDTVYLGAFRKSVFDKIGLFDERFTRNQDDELNYRIVKGGGRIFLTPRIRMVYYPRGSLRALFSQYFQYGEWKVAVIRKHGSPARPTHLVPALFVLFNLLGLALIWWPPARALYLSVMALYLLLDVLFSFTNPEADTAYKKLTLIWIHIVLHVSYGLGFLRGLFRGMR